MKLSSYLRTIAIFISLLIISLPFIHAEELNLITDANGNLITGDSFYREYNELNQLVRIRSGNTSSGQILEEFIWHPIEERILVKDVFSNGVLNYSIYYVNKNYVHIENSSGNYSEKYVYQDNVLVAQVNTDGNKEFIHNDHLGSTTLITDEQGNAVENSFYSPKGEILSGGDVGRYTFTGKEFSKVTQDYDFLARRYRPDWGIFLQCDTVRNNIYDPQALNCYSYVLNNPYKYTDPDGKNPIVVALGAGFIIGSLYYMATTPLTETSGWERVGRTYAHGANVGIHSAAAFSFTTAGGAFRVAKGGSTLYNTFKLGSLGASSYTVSRIIEDKPIIPEDLAYNAFTNTIPLPSQLRGGEYVSKLNPFTLQNLRVLNDVFASEGLQILMSNLFPYLQNINSNANLANQNANQNFNQGKSSGSGGGGGYVGGVGYVTQGGNIYPTTNPNFRPNPNVPRVCISGCKK